MNTVRTRDFPSLSARSIEYENLLSANICTRLRRLRLFEHTDTHTHIQADMRGTRLLRWTVEWAETIGFGQHKLGLCQMKCLETV